MFVRDFLSCEKKLVGIHYLTDISMRNLPYMLLNIKTREYHTQIKIPFQIKRLKGTKKFDMLNVLLKEELFVIFITT